MRAYAIDSNATLDKVMQLCGLRNDAALAVELNVLPPVISHIRHGRAKVTASLALKMLDLFDMTPAQGRDKLGLL